MIFHKMVLLIVSLLVPVTVCSHFLVFRVVNGRRIEPTANEFNRAHEILVRYQFPMYVYDGTISAADKNVLDSNEVAFLQQKIQREVAPDLFVQDVSPTLYSVAVYRVFLMACAVREILHMLEQVQPIKAEYVNSECDEFLWLQPYVAPLLETGGHAPDEWLALLTEADRNRDSDSESFALSDVDRFRNFVNAMNFEHAEDDWLNACLHARKKIDFARLRNDFAQRYAILVRLDELLKERGLLCEDDFSDAILIPMQKNNVDDAAAYDDGSNLFAFSTHDEVRTFLTYQWPGYVERCFQKMRLGGFVLIDAIVNRFLLMRDFPPVRLIQECGDLMNVVSSWRAAYWAMGKELILYAIGLEQRGQSRAFIYRGTETQPRVEWERPFNKLHSLSFGKTVLSGFIYDNEVGLPREGVLKPYGSVPLPYMISRKYAYAICVDHAQYRREFESGINTLFLPPCTVTYDFFGQGMSYHPRRKLLKHSLRHLEGLTEIPTLSGENSVSAAPFYMTPWENYRDYQEHSAAMVPNIVMIKE